MNESEGQKTEEQNTMDTDAGFYTVVNAPWSGERSVVSYTMSSDQYTPSDPFEDPTGNDTPIEPPPQPEPPMEEPPLEVPPEQDPPYKSPPIENPPRSTPDEVPPPPGTVPQKTPEH